MSLEPTFSLTPKSSGTYISDGHKAFMYVFGSDFFAGGAVNRYSFEGQHANDELFFWGSAAVPLSTNKRHTRHIQLTCNVSDLGPHKELALVLGFDVVSSEARVLVYSDAGQLEDVTLVQGDNHLLIEVESIDSDISLYFIHVPLPNSSVGGSWFLRGITGYVI